MPRKNNFTLEEKHNEMLVEIQKEFGLCKSDSVRRAIELLHDYLIKNIQPENSKSAEISAKVEKSE